MRCCPRIKKSNIIQFIDNLLPAIEPSLLLDLETGRPTEIDDRSGSGSRPGRRAGIEVPVHDTSTAALGGGPLDEPEACA
jgi:ketopantoate reductase